jgi:DNA-binding transcriptional MerR regulator
MRIGELTRATGVSRRLLRYYEEQGLLSPTRLANGYRDYAPGDVDRVRHIRVLLATRLPTAVIGRVLHCVHDDADHRGIVPSACPAMVTSLQRQQARLADEIAQLRSSQQAVDSLLAVALRQAV